MKKVLIGLGSVLIMAFVVVLVANASGSAQDDKKAKTEVKKDCSKCPNAAACSESKDIKTACDPEKCKAAGCDPEKCKATGCDQANCKQKCEKAGGADMKSCDPAACPGHTKKQAVN